MTRPKFPILNSEFLKRLGLTVAVLALATLSGAGLVAAGSHSAAKAGEVGTSYPTGYKIDPQVLCPNCNVVLISMTNLRYDHTGFSGYSRPTTPNLDELARDSLDFTNSYSVSSWTLPGIISILTSLYPYQHGVMDRYDGSSLSPKQLTLPDILRRDEYTSYSASGYFDHTPAQGLMTHFDKYDYCYLPGYRAGSSDEGPQYGHFDCGVGKATTWLQANSSKKFFLHLQGFDAHCPFNQSTPHFFDPTYQNTGNINYSSCLWTFGKTDPVKVDGETLYPVYSENTAANIYLKTKDVTHLVATYDEAITLADRQIGQFIATLKSLGLYDKTIIIFTSEHGDMFGKYGRFMRGGPIRGTFYDDVIHVPLLIHIPGVGGKKVTGLASAVDVMPTVLSLLGLPQTSWEAGTSLLPLIKIGQPVQDYIYAGSNFNSQPNNIYFNHNSRIEVVRSLSWKLIEETVYNEDKSVSVSDELYNIAQDPEELHNLAQSDTAELSYLKGKLASWSSSVRAQPKFCYLCLN